VERAVVLAPGGVVEPAHLPLHIQGTAPLGITFGDGLLSSKNRLVREFERQAVTRLLADARGNVSAAAKVARITRRNFHRLLTKHKIDPRKFKHGVINDSLG
jgi:DNA-binding NtrC family response regulator